jgi:hypothetical protein
MIRQLKLMLTAAALVAIQTLGVVAAPKTDLPEGHVVIVLDCSAHMSEPLAATGEESKTSRLDAAREAAGELLARLAKDGKHGVTLVLAGHRIAAASAEGEAADLQVEYLKLNDGKLERVPPGLDVEIVHESRPLTTADVAGYEKTLAAVKPWGDSPLWLAIERAAESAPPAKSDAKNRVILLTNGTNEQTGVEEAATAKQALLALRSQKAALHVIQFGKTRSSADLAALARTADATGGEVLAPTSARQATESLLVAAGVEQPRQPVTDPLVRPIVRVQEVQPPAPDIAPIDPNADLRDQLRYFDTAVEVTYWGQPVKDATVYLRGKSFDIKYDRSQESADKLLREDRLTGRYNFSKVVKGAYLLDITVNHKNRRYVIEREIVVDEALLAPGNHAIEIQIERFKDPPPAQ